MYGEKRNLETMLNIIENSHQIELFIDMSYSKLEKIRLEKLQWSPCQPGQSNLSSKQGMFTSIAHIERIEKERERVEKELVKYEEDLKEMDEFLERIARKKAHRYIIYKYRHGMTHKEIAEIMGGSRSLIQKVIKKTLQELEKEM